MPSSNTLVVHDTEYEINPRYLDGALAFRGGVPYSCNPHRFGTQSHDDWDYGHVNESAGEHFRFGIDIVLSKRAGQRFEMDPSTPRNQCGDVEWGWLRGQRALHANPEAASAAA